MIVYHISVLHTNRDSFDYIAVGIEPCIGARVWVPFRNKTKVGVVLGITEKESSQKNLKSITSIIDNTPLLSNDMLALCRWIGEYYQSPLSEVFPLMLPKKYRLGHERQLLTYDYYSLKTTKDNAHLVLSPRATRQHQLIDFIGYRTILKNEITAAGFTMLQLDNLVNNNLLLKQSMFVQPATQCLSDPLRLNEEQAEAFNVITKQLDNYHCVLLQGVTGSGKTEVYLQVIATVLAKGQQVLILVPEIGLTPQLLARFSSRFAEPMVVIHSNLNDTERQQAWQLAQDNHAKLVIGTRSAIFTPMPLLGLIVVDEEHDASLKQMEGVRYSARDTALMRAHRANIPIILGSATPSLESLYNCTLDKYTLLRLNQKALTSSSLHYQVVDIRNQHLQHGLAPTSLALIGEHLQQGNQVLVFINRRGYSPVVLCHQCGWMADCSACDTHLTLHRAINQLMCHHCGLTQKMFTHCQSCKSHDLLPIGSGTQRIFDYLSSQYPTTSILRVDRDEVSKKNAIDEHLTRIHKGEAQLIVGTQMLAKGHHFPRLTLVVVLDADNGFYNQDFRALERLGQLLTQVSGRAGRAEFPGQIVIQTHIPQHPLLTILIQEGYERFAQLLLEMRQQAALPPYSYLAMLRAQSKNQAKLQVFMQAAKDQIKLQHIIPLGPAPAPLARKADQHRMQLLIKSPSRKKLGEQLTLMRDWLKTYKLDSGLRWNIDVDPIDLS
ncbi:MAG: primosomal protein N' [Legionellaceae bacterium]|nr:primosomal protein N' [Legionellaceae bacterium]